MTVQVLVFFGMIATGKSYLASAWAARHGCAYYNSDRVRKELAGLTPESRQTSGLEQGIYSSDFTRRTYDRLLELAEQELNLHPDGCVVLDGSYQVRSERERLVARLGYKSNILFVHCVCPEETMRQRMEERLLDTRAVSDGRWEIYLQQKKRFEAPVELNPEQLLNIDTNDSLDTLLLLLDGRVKRDATQATQA